MDTHFLIAFGTSCIAALIATGGILLVKNYKQWSEKNIDYFICFAAGMLISVSFLHLVPESYKISSDAPVILLCGYFFMHILNRFVTTYVCHDHDHEHSHKEIVLGIVPVIGIALHSFLDGVVYSITFSHSIFTGIMAATGMVLHELAEGIVVYMLLKKGGMGEKQATVIALAASAMTTPVGMLVSYPMISTIDGEMLGSLLALSAGALIYVGATHLLPHTEQESKKYSLLALAAGILSAFIISVSV